MRKAFNFYKSYWEQIKLLNNKQKLEIFNAICQVQFLEISIDDVAFKDNVSNIVWVGIKHSVLTSLSGFISKQKGLNKVVDLPLSKGGVEAPYQEEQVQEEGKEEGEEEYSDEIKNFTHSILKHFPIQPKKIEEWYKVTYQLINIDKYNYDSILLIVETFTKDEFWAKNFQSYTKLRKKNKDQIKYIDYFKNTLIAEKNGKDKRNSKEGCTWDELAEVLKKHEITEE